MAAVTFDGVANSLKDPTDPASPRGTVQRVPAVATLKDDHRSPLMANAEPGAFPSKPYAAGKVLTNENGWQEFWDTERGGPNGFEEYQRFSWSSNASAIGFSTSLLLFVTGCCLLLYLLAWDSTYGDLDQDAVARSTWTFSFVVWVCCAAGVLTLCWELANFPTRFITRMISARRVNYLQQRAVQLNALHPDYTRSTQLLGFAVNPQSNYVSHWNPFANYSVFASVPSDYCPRSLSEYSNARGTSVNKLVLAITNALAATVGIKIFLSSGYPDTATWCVGWIAAIFLLGVGNFETNSFFASELIHSCSMALFMGFIYGHLLSIGGHEQDWVLTPIAAVGAACYIAFLGLSWGAGVYGPSSCANRCPLGPATAHRCSAPWITSYALMLLELFAVLIPMIMLTYDWIQRDDMRTGIPI